MIVVDASVALKWFLIEERMEAALSLAASAEPLAAPDLIIPEVCNGAWKSARLGRLTFAQVAFVAEALPKYFTKFVPSEVLAERAVNIAGHLDHPVYDCFYVALAERLNAPLITDDARLCQAVQGTDWEARIERLR